MSTIAVVPAFNKQDSLRECVLALLDQGSELTGVVVVDDASTPPIEAPTDERVHWVRLPRNHGSAAAFAAGISLALELGAQWVWTFDDDARPGPGTLAPLLRLARGGGARIVSPLIAGSSGEILHECNRRFDPRTCREEVVELTPSVSRATEVDSTSWVGTLFPRDVFSRVGLPDVRYRMYCDDTDLCLRARKAGFDIVVTPDVVVHHDSRARPDRLVPARTYLRVRNRLWLYRRHAEGGTRAWRNEGLRQAGRQIVGAARARQARRCLAAARGVVDGLLRS